MFCEVDCREAWVCTGSKSGSVSEVGKVFMATKSTKVDTVRQQSSARSGCIVIKLSRSCKTSKGSHVL